MREVATYAYYTSRQIPLRSVHVPICHSSLMTSLNTECTNTAFVILQTEKLKYSKANNQIIQRLRVWLLATNTSALFEAILYSFLPINTCYKSCFSLIAFFPLHTHWYIRLPSLPTPAPLFSVSGQLGLCGACAVAIGRLGQCDAIRLPLLACGCARTWSLRAGGAHE